MRKSIPLFLFALLALASTASAEPVLWDLSGVTLFDGGSVTGSFDFDADAGTPCSTAALTCGLYSNIEITTTAASPFGANTFMYACGQDVASCTAVSPNSTEVLLLTSNASDQDGLPGLALFFTGVSVNPPGGLSDSGGTFDISDSSFEVGAVEEGFCNNPACSAPVSPTGSVAGTVVAATPEPSSLALTLLPILSAAFWRRRWLAA
jgi:hypothetical protein